MIYERHLMNTILYFLEIVGISLFVSLAISGFVNYFGYRKSYENFGELSEQIFEKLGFEYPKEQDFYNEFLTALGSIAVSRSMTVAAVGLPMPNSALSSNSELDQAGPRPSALTA